jgi:nucleoside phosphorylase
LIHCAKVEEADAVRNVFKCKATTMDTTEDRLLKITNVTLDKFTVLITNQKQQGPTSTAVAVTKLLEMFPNIKLLIMSGICAGIKNPEMKIGDVVAATACYEFSRGAARYEGEIRLDVSPISADEELIAWLKEKDNQRGWDEYILQSDNNNKPNILFGEIVASPFLERNLDEDSKSFLLAKRKTIALDMESGSMFQVSYDFDLKFTIFKAEKELRNECKKLVIKSVSDYGDSKKNDDFQRSAEANAAALVLHIVLKAKHIYHKN